MGDASVLAGDDELIADRDPEAGTEVDVRAVKMTGETERGSGKSVDVRLVRLVGEERWS